MYLKKLIILHTFTVENPILIIISKKMYNMTTYTAQMVISVYFFFYKQTCNNCIVVGNCTRGKHSYISSSEAAFTSNVRKYFTFFWIFFLGQQNFKVYLKKKKFS